MSAIERAAEVIEGVFLDTRQGKMRNDWVTGEEVAERLANAGLLLSDADRAVLALGRAVQQITADWVVVDEIYRRAARVLPEWSYEEARRALAAIRARRDAAQQRQDDER